MNIFKKAVVRFKFRMAADLIASIDKTLAGRKDLGRAIRRNFWREFHSSPEARKRAIANLRRQLDSL